MVAMPTVAPRASVQRRRWSLSTSVSSHAVPRSVSRLTMITTFAAIGLHAAAKKRRRALRYADSRPVAP